MTQDRPQRRVHRLPDSLCRRYDLNPHELLRRCDLDPLALRRPDLYVPYASFARALNLAAAEGPAPSFGLQLSEYHDYLVLGPFGLLLAQSENFAEVLKLTQQYVHLHAQGIALHLTAKASACTWNTACNCRMPWTCASCASWAWG
ncbi:hypothetical protein SSTU70S_06289 [Stutzerimonas stutzeri]